MNKPKRDAVGRVLAERYELVSRLGEGGASNVWLAHDRTLKITVAVKVLRRELSSRKPMLEQFQREAELSARMHSPNIVRVLGCGVDTDGTAYIAYELLDGEDLNARLVRKTRIDLTETEMTIVHICRALSRAHAMGVIHRDIKPANAFVTKDDDGRRIVKVVDFGVAALVKGDLPTEELSGTLEYMAPEILLEGKPPEARSDLYSVAVLAYRCLVGHVPFSGDALGQVMVALATTKPPKISVTLGLGMNGEELDEWFEKGLARDPADRFASARELAESFHTAVKLAKAGQAAPVREGSQHPLAPAETKDDVVVFSPSAKRIKLPTPPAMVPSPPSPPPASSPNPSQKPPPSSGSPPRLARPASMGKPPPLPSAAKRAEVAQAHASTQAPKVPRDLPPMRKPAPSFVFEPDLDEPNPPDPTEVSSSFREKAAGRANERMQVVEVDASNSGKKDDRRG